MSSPTHSCPACRSSQISEIVEIRDMPVHIGSLWPTAEQARSCPKGDITLAHCHDCQLVFNAAFDPKPLEYTQDYDNSLEGSSVFTDFATGLAKDLIARYDLHEKKVIEIGCGKGYFVGLLCQHGPNDGVGFDTTYDEKSENPCPGRLKFVKAHYTAEQTEGPADLVACRHVLEHIPDPISFVEMLRESLREQPDTTVYFEVPEVMLIVRDLSIWDIMYEHCTYFGHESLAALFARAGFEILRLENHFDDQFLSIEARPATGATRPPEIAPELRIADRVAAFADHFAQRKAEWAERLDRLPGEGHKVAIWAAGAKTVSFMNLFDASDKIDAIVDINPRKQGMHLPGTGHEILKPEALVDVQPDTVIVMNPHYRDEIAADLSRMGLEPEILDA